MLIIEQFIHDIRMTKCDHVIHVINELLTNEGQVPCSGTAGK